MAFYCMHTYAKERIEQAKQLTDGTQFNSQHGYIQRRTLIIGWALPSEIPALIETARQGGFVVEGEPQYTFSINEQIQLYNVEVHLVKYSKN